MKSNRRKFFQTMGAGVAGLTIGATAMPMASSASTSAKKDDDRQILFIGDNF